MFVLGWTADAQTHWIGPQIGCAILLFGLTLAFNSIQNLCVSVSLRADILEQADTNSIVDAFMPYSAAGTAAATAVSGTDKMQTELPADMSSFAQYSLAYYRSLLPICFPLWAGVGVVLC
jgi:hypothetical protein